MRNPERLDKIYDIICKYHKEYFPDWRIGQFIVNLSTWHMNQYKTDMFYIEEDEFIKRLNEFFKEMKKYFQVSKKIIRRDIVQHYGKTLREVRKDVKSE